MIIKRNIKFSLKKQKNASCRVIMRVSFNGLRLDFQTGIVIKEDFWDATKESVKCSNSGNRLDSEMNDHLTSMKVKMTDVFHHYELLGKLPNKDELRSSFNEESSVKLVQVVENNSTPSNDKLYF